MMLRPMFSASRRVYCKPLRSTFTRSASVKTTPPLQHLPRSRQWPPASRKTRIAIYVLALGSGAHVFVSYFYSVDPAYGISMLPTISSFGDWVLVSKYYRRGRGVKVGDVVSFKHPVREGEYAIKRIIGLEGDFVLMNTPGKSETVIQIPQGHCWVTGDNLAHSRDSRMFGPLPMALLHGKIIAKFNKMPYLPLPQFSWIEHGLQDACTDEDDI